MEKEHNYDVEKTNNGFQIYSKKYDKKIEYIMNPYGFWEEHIDSKKGEHSVFDFDASFLDFSRTYYNEIPAFAFRQIISSATDFLYRDWKCKEGTKFQVEVKIKEWAKSKTGKVLNSLIYPMWKEKLLEIDPLIRDLHRSLFSVSAGAGCFFRIKDIINDNDTYSIADIMKYRAARIHLLYKQTSYGSRYEFSENWMMDYSCNNDLYGSLRKTISNLPAKIIPRMLLGLNSIFLPEPATSRIRLLSYLTVAQRWNRENIGVITRSTDEQIKDSVRYIWNLYPGKKKSSMSSASEIVRALGIIFDMPGEYGKIDIVGAARRSHDYHRNIERQNRIEQEKYMKENAEKMKEKTAIPPIPMPNNDKIKFLSTYGEVVEEGNLMKHCIGTYAAQAVRGYSYLFHVDYQGEMASVEVGPDGVVKQSYGPRDSYNKASEYGKRILSQWAKGLQKVEVPIQMREMQYNF